VPVLLPRRADEEREDVVAVVQARVAAVDDVRGRWLGEHEGKMFRRHGVRLLAPAQADRTCVLRPVYDALARTQEDAHDEVGERRLADPRVAVDRPPPDGRGVRDDPQDVVVARPDPYRLSPGLFERVDVVSLPPFKADEAVLQELRSRRICWGASAGPREAACS